MRLISLWEPYLAGVLAGDGWCSYWAIGLRVKDYEFAATFARALNHGFSTELTPKRDERGYWLVRTSNKTGKFSRVKSFMPKSDSERGAWLRGLFDSEGNAHIYKLQQWQNSFNRSVRFFSTERTTLVRAQGFLSVLGIASRILQVKSSAGHIGSKTMWRLGVQCSLDNFARFQRYVGSSVLRKRRYLNRIVKSYRRVA